MRIILSPKAKLPLNACRGSEAKRYKMADIMSKKLFNELSQFSEDNCPVDEFKKAIDRVTFPHKINFTIEKITQKEKNNNIIACLRKIINVTEKPDKSPKDVVIEGFRFILPIKKDKIQAKIAALHETRHFFDHICNPKTTEFTSAKLHSKTDLADRKTRVHNLFVNTFDHNLDVEMIANSAKIHLDAMPDEIAINSLNGVRYNLKSELNAYKDEIKFLNKSKASNYEINQVRALLKSAKFKEKLKIVNKLLEDRLLIARNNLKQSGGVQA